MGVKTVAVYSNSDMASIAWETDNPIPGCRGFALERQVAGAAGQAASGFINTWVGFKGEDHTDGESRPSTVWPIQRYIWSDYLVSIGQKARYRVIPMLGPAGKLTQAPESEWSDWTRWVSIDTDQTKGFHAYFNRGIVPAQALARQANNSKQFHDMLQKDINNPGSKNRDFLGGALRSHLLELLAQAKKSGAKIYAALYELNDPELMAALKGIGKNCSLILASGAYKAADNKKGTPAEPDENKASRAVMKKSVHVFDRLVKSPHFAHNKFVVFCDPQDRPVNLWTGSTNWTVTGLCTQSNNGILIDSPDLAKAYKTRWDELRAAGAAYPKPLAQQGSTPARGTLGDAKLTAWNAPCNQFVDLKSAKKYIAAASDGVLFLMFNPGVGDGKKREKSLIQDILALDPNKLFIHGVLNQDPGGKKAPLIQLTHKGQQLPAKPLEAILPKTLKAAGRKWFRDEFSFNMVMIHSKLVVIDPFGKKPVVMTGSHNMGPKASASNDDNMVIIENAPDLAAEYAVYVMNVYGHYKWLYNEYLRQQGGSSQEKDASKQFDGNQDNDIWQHWYLDGPNRLEIEFWLAGAQQASTANAD